MTIKIDNVAATAQQLAQFRTDLELVGKQPLFMSAAGMKATSTTGCNAVTWAELGASYPEIAYMEFNPTSISSAQFALIMPDSWDKGTLTFKAYFTHIATSGTPGVVWQLQAIGIGNGETLLANYGTAQKVTTTSGATADILRISTESPAITVAGTLGTADLVTFKISRVPTDGGDTLAVNARLLGILLYLSTDKVISP